MQYGRTYHVLNSDLCGAKEPKQEVIVVQSS